MILEGVLKAVWSEGEQSAKTAKIIQSVQTETQLGFIHNIRIITLTWGKGQYVPSDQDAAGFGRLSK